MLSGPVTPLMSAGHSGSSTGVRVDNHAEIQQLLGLLGTIGFVSLHRSQRPPSLLGRAGIDAGLADEAAARFDAQVRFERRRSDRDCLKLTLATAEGCEIKINAWPFPLERDALVLLATDPAPPPTWVEAYVELWWRRRCEAEWNEWLRGALDLVDLGVVLLDTEGRIAFANVGAQRLLDAGDGVRRLGGSVGATAFEDAVRLQTAIGRALQRDGVRSEVPLLTLRRANGRPIAVTVVPVPPLRHLGDPAVTIYLLDPDTNVERVLAPVCDAYQLTATEAQLARSIVAGATLAEAATAQRIRLETARSYLKQIFAKTGTHRQAELVRVMLSGILRAGPAAIARY